MVKKVIWSSHSIADRIVILDYWYRRIGNKKYSKRLDRSLKNAIKLLAKYPFIGRKYKNTEIRFFIKGTYQIFYKISEDLLRILHIWDSRRDPEELKL